MTRLWFEAVRPTYVLRRARPADAETIADVYVACWREAYAGILPADYLARMDPARFARDWHRTLSLGGWAFLAEVEGEVVGIASGGRSRTPDLAAGELYVLYVRAAHQRRGIGRALFEACHYRLAMGGLAGMVAWTLAAGPGRGFYERMGGTLASEKVHELNGIPCREVAYVWPE